MIKATGIVRRVDELGRVVIPIELRRLYGIDEKDALEIWTDDDKILLRKYQPLCVFCGSGSDVTMYKGKNVCASCVTALGQPAAGAQSTVGLDAPHRHFKGG